MEQQWTAVDGFISDKLVASDAALDQALRLSAAAGLPEINVAPNQGKFLMLLGMMLGARNILEIGTLGGYSTIWLARGLAKGGRLITLEMDEKHADVARANIAHAGLADAVELRLGRAIDTLAKLDAEGRGPFDLVFIDADKASTPEYFDWAVRHSRRRSVIVVDNVVRNGEILDANCTDASTAGVQRFYDLLAKDKRVSATAIQTVGIKGYDGFAIALVTGNVGN